MKRSALVLSAALLFGGTGLFAQEVLDPAKIEAQKKELATQRKELDTKKKELGTKLSASDALAAERKAAAEARKALEEKIASDPDVKKARDGEKEAQAKLAKAVDAKLAASPERVAAAKAASELDAKRLDLQYQSDLIELQLNSPFSPFAADVDADAEVVAAKAKVAELTNAIDKQPTADVTAARKAVAEAKAELSKADSDAKITAAHKTVAEAQAALKDAQAKDPRHEKVTKAREAYQAARVKKMESMPEAKALLDEAKALEAKLADNTKARGAVEAVLDIHGEAIGAEDKEVGAALAKLEAAKNAQAEALASSGLAAMREQLTAAQKVRDEKAAAAAAKEAGYADSVKKEAELKATIEKLSANLKALSAPDIEQLARARAEYKAASTAAYNARRAKWQDASVKADFEKANELYHGFNSKSGSTPAVAAAKKALSAATKELDALRDAKARALPAAKPAVEKLAALNAEARELKYKHAIAEFKLESKNSPIKLAVDADAAVMAANKAWADADAAPAAAPVTAAQAKVKEAQAALKDAQSKSESYTKAASTESAAEKALKDAGNKDARHADLTKAQAALKDLRAKKLAAAPKAADLAAQQKKVAEQIAEIEKAKKAAGGGAAEQRKKIEASDDAEIVALKKEIAEQQKKIKEIPQDKRFEEARAAVKRADEALSAKVTQTVAADAGMQALQKDLDANSAKAKELEDQLKASKKKAPATKPAKEAKGKATTKPSQG